MYNQTLSKETWYSCVFFGLLNILYYKFWIFVTYAWIYRFNSLLKKFWVILTWGAVTGTLYTYCINRINKQLWLKFEIEKASISRGNLRDGEYYGVGFKKLNTKYIELVKDGRLTRKEIDLINLMKWNGHHAMFEKWTDILTDPFGNFKYHLPFENLQYWVETGFAYDTARSITTYDTKTKEVLEILKQMNEKTWDWKNKNISENAKIAGKIFGKNYNDIV